MEGIGEAEAEPAFDGDIDPMRIVPFGGGVYVVF